MNLKAELEKMDELEVEDIMANLPRSVADLAEARRQKNYETAVAIAFSLAQDLAFVGKIMRDKK